MNLVQIIFVGICIATTIAAIAGILNKNKR